MLDGWTIIQWLNLNNFHVDIFYYISCILIYTRYKELHFHRIDRSCNVFLCDLKRAVLKSVSNFSMSKFVIHACVNCTGRSYFILDSIAQII